MRLSTTYLNLKLDAPKHIYLTLEQVALILQPRSTTVTVARVISRQLSIDQYEQSEITLPRDTTSKTSV